jgi:hypothetical protein
VPRDERKETNHSTTVLPLPLAGDAKSNKFQYTTKALPAYDSTKLQMASDKKPQNYKELRKEFEEVKKNQKAYMEFKEGKAHETKLNRIISNGYKGTLTGIDSIYNPNTQIFKEQQKKIVEEFTSKETINERRKASIKTYKPLPTKQQSNLILTFIIRISNSQRMKVFVLRRKN